MHMTKQLKFKISQLRKDKMIAGIESISVFIFALFISVFLPNLLMQYVYTDPNLTALPPVVQYTPLVAFVVAVGYFLYAMIGNMTRMMTIKKLEKELAESYLMDDGCCGGACSCGPHDFEMSSMSSGHSAMDMDIDEPSSSSKTESLGLLAEKMKSTKAKKSSKK